MLYLSFFGLIVFLLSLIVPFVAIELGQLTQALPQFVSSLSGALEKAQQTTSSKYFDFFGEIQNLLDSFSQFLFAYSQSAISLIINIFGGALSFVAIIIISFYLSVMRRGVIGFISSIMPEKYESYVISLWKRAEFKVGRWLQGQFLLALSVGLMVYVGLSLLKLNTPCFWVYWPWYWKSFQWLDQFFGNSGIDSSIYSNHRHLVSGISFYIAVQQIENNIFVPLILGKTLGLNPVTVIIALLVGGKIAGIPVCYTSAVPVAVIIVEILDDLARQKKTVRQGNLIYVRTTDIIGRKPKEATG